MGYAPIYTNNKIIAKPPVKASKESLGSAINSFYNDIARIERTETERTTKHQDIVTATTSATNAAVVMEQASVSNDEAKPEIESETACNTETTTTKEKKKKKVVWHLLFIYFLNIIFLHKILYKMLLYDFLL